MANNDVVDRNKILGSATQDYGFDKVLRGYDIKQVNEYISNLLATNKNAGELFDQRYEELKRTYGETLLNEVAELQCDKKIDYEYDPSAPKLTNIQIEAWNALKKDEDKSYDNSFKLKLARYELHEDFERLIDSLYPR